MYDYLIIGQGIAGTTLAHKLISEEKKVCVIDEAPEVSASKIASGLWNPIVLKRMKKVWMADQMLEVLLPFYKKVQQTVNQQIIDDLKIRRIFNSIEEQNNWFQSLDNPKFKSLLSSSIDNKTDSKINAGFGLGTVLQSGRINVKLYLEASQNYFSAIHAYKEEQILYQEIHVEDELIRWKGYEAKHLIFCEGHQARFNPWFSYLPFAVTKGEVMTVTSDLNLTYPLHGGKFILPLGEGKFKIGATYEWDELNEKTTTKGTDQLNEGWDKITASKKTVISQQAGIRPTVKDRRPLLGTHPKHPNIHIFNGLGSRGILMAPYLADCMTAHLNKHDYLHPEMDIARFNDLIS